MNLFLVYILTVFVTLGTVIGEDESATLLKIIEKHELMIRRLEEKIDKQDKRIAELERGCDHRVQKVSDIHDAANPYEDEVHYHGRNETEKPRDLKNTLKAVTPRKNNKGENNVVTSNLKHRRFLLETPTPSAKTSTVIGFYAYLGTHDSSPAPNKVIVFDTIKATSGHDYNPYSGIFTIPESGMYVFTWTIECDGNGQIFTKIVKNSSVFGSIASDSNHEIEYRMSTGVALTLANKGDIVFVQVHSAQNTKIHSSDYARSSFSGWKLN
ncbi:uncharacterized protein LOC134280052 [Saccostrea cucullata]|uniref:uncharacterized protein LOC134280052 n=1 Tax=Saccostrea cuccullata TaxID=36930 RepID=UPI002ED26910